MGRISSTYNNGYCTSNKIYYINEYVLYLISWYVFMIFFKSGNSVELSNPSLNLLVGIKVLQLSMRHMYETQCKVTLRDFYFLIFHPKLLNSSGFLSFV